MAYADFVTAMMAFFMLMWLLNATTEKQRKGIADYFSPTVPVSRISGGGDGSFGGESIETHETLSEDGDTMFQQIGRPVTGAGGDEEEESERLWARIEEALMGRGGESVLGDEVYKHIVTRVTDEGLIIEIFDLEGKPLFEEGTDTPTLILTEITGLLEEALNLTRNDIAVVGYVQSAPIVVSDNPVWRLSMERASQVRELLETVGVSGNRMERVTGYADNAPAARNPLAARNNRIEIILLR